MATLTGEATVYLGPPIDDARMLSRVPAAYRDLLVRNEVVHRLLGETGDLESLGIDLEEFDQRSRKDPIEFLGLHPLVRFRADGGELEPGQLLNALPPFCSVESGAGLLGNLPSVNYSGQRRSSDAIRWADPNE
jgi:hypothetical protein